MRVWYRFSFVTGMLLAMPGVSIVSPASAQQVAAPNRSVQAVPPAQGAIAWGPQDNCVYKFHNGSWYRQDICRIMQGPLAYITYRPSTGQRLASYDESEPGWVKGMDLTVANPYVIAYPTVAGRNVMVLVNNRWVDAATAQRSFGQQQSGSVHSNGQDGSSILLGHMRRNQEARAEEARKAEEEAYYKRKRDEQYYDEKRRTKEYYERQRIEKDRLEREAIQRAQANRDNQRALDDLAAARRAQQRADDAAAAARRQAQRAADEAAAAARRARIR